MTWSVYYLIAISSVFIASLSQILLKKSAMKTYPTIVREYLNPYVVIGYTMMVFSMLLTMLAYRGLELKQVAVIEPIGNVFVLVWGYLFFREKISFRKVVGILLIFAGFIVFNMGGKGI